MEDLLFTRDGRYVSGLGRIIDIETGLHTDIDNPNPIFICEMFRNETLFIYKHSIMESKQLFSNIRKLLYRLMESDMNVIMEYEIKFGRNLITESTKSLLTEQIISDSWDFVKNKIFEKYSFLLENWFEDQWNKAKKFGGKVVQGVKDVASWVLNKGIPWIMEKIENFMMSPVGIGLDVALTSIGIGKLATGTIWGILLIWKVYKLLSGKSNASDVWTYIDIAICLAGIVFSGAAKGLKAAFKAAGGSVMKVGAKVLQPIITVISKGLGGIFNLLIKPIEWVSKFLGPKASGMVSSFKSGFGKIFEKMKNIFVPAASKTGVQGAEALTLKSGVKKYIKKDFINPARVASKELVGKGIRRGLTFGSGVALINKGAEKTTEYYANKNKKETEQAIGKVASAVGDDVIKQGVESDMNDLLNKL
jgi:hypothetical protein